MASKTDVLRRQRRWADAYGVRYDARGCVRDVASNLRVPLEGLVLAELARGSELAPGLTRPPRIQSLCSSAALVANVFGYWRERDAAPLARALGLEAAGAVGLSLEEPLPTGVPGDPPLADVALRFSSTLVTVESKFSEWLVRRPRNQSGLKDKYFASGRKYWLEAGLPLTQALAEDLRDGHERYKFLHTAQLLKHALGLAKSGERRPTLVYLYYDWPGREARAHSAELERVRGCLGAEVALHGRTYQELYRALAAMPGIARDYLDYLEQRYFGA